MGGDSESEWLPPPRVLDPRVVPLPPSSFRIAKLDRSCLAEGAAPEQRGARASLLWRAPYPRDALLVLLLVSPVSFSRLSLPARKGPGLAAGGTTGRRARRANTTWARRSVVAAAAPPDPRPIAPRRARHLLNPLGLGLSRPLGPRGAGPIGQKLPRTRVVEIARPGVPAPGLGARRLPAPQTWASPSILVAPGKQPSGTKTRPRPGSVPCRRRNLLAPLTRVSFRRSRPRPAAAGRQREGAPALAGRAHGAAAFPFSSQRKCFGRQIIPGDMKLLRPPHVARKKNRNEHLWRDELVEDLTDVLSTSFLGRAFS
ncbi:unnamed protein product [Rangifer tarandus platyrhynchus]|uniref:Uncharacterized protein n=1 Tax=Rangifer tarandus platyrhynchus TaxID=3082113 RepID=A0ABN8YAB1_RANTA|nr:unnamed protein product [Rangifer tarandus platyrhynchus]